MVNGKRTMGFGVASYMCPSYERATRVYTLASPIPRAGMAQTLRKEFVQVVFYLRDHKKNWGSDFPKKAEHNWDKKINNNEEE